MTYDYTRLSGKILETFGTRYQFARAMGLSKRSVSRKMNNKTCWKQREIARACGLLGLEDDEIAIYFFAQGVQ